MKADKKGKKAKPPKVDPPQVNERPGGTVQFVTAPEEKARNPRHVFDAKVIDTGKAAGLMLRERRGPDGLPWMEFRSLEHGMGFRISLDGAVALREVLSAWIAQPIPFKVKVEWAATGGEMALAE